MPSAVSTVTHHTWMCYDKAVSRRAEGAASRAAEGTAPSMSLRPERWCELWREKAVCTTVGKKNLRVYLTNLMNVPRSLKNSSQKLIVCVEIREEKPFDSSIWVS